MSALLKLQKIFLGVGALRLLSIPLGLATSILLARVLGPSDFGQYAFIMSLLPLLALPVTGAVQTLVTREVAGYMHRRSWELCTGVIYSSQIWVLAISFLIVVVYWSLAFVFKIVPMDDKWALLPLAILLTPLLGLHALYLGFIKGFRKPAFAEFSSQLLQPLAVLIIALAFLYTGQLNTSSVITAQIVATGMAALVTLLFFLRIKPRNLDSSHRQYQLSRWANSLAPFTLLALLSTFNAKIAIIIIGFVGSDEQVAAMRVAERGAQFVPISQMIVNLVIAPYFVRAYQDADFQHLQTLFKKSARFSFLIAVPIALTLLIAGKAVIQVLFGLEYADIAYIPLVILVTGQLANVFFGSVAYLLSMCGHEKDTLKGQLTAVMINVALGTLLIPYFGATGAAIAVSVGVLSWNLVMCYWVIKRIGIRPTVL